MALSKDALKMYGMPRSSVIVFMVLAMWNTVSLDSITQGPAIRKKHFSLGIYVTQAFLLGILLQRVYALVSQRRYFGAGFLLREC